MVPEQLRHLGKKRMHNQHLRKTAPLKGEEMGMIAFCDTENIMPPRRVPGLDVGGMGTPTVVGDDAREMGVIVAERGDAAVGRMPCTIVLARAIVGHHGF